jgi:hypothetical protein
MKLFELYQQNTLQGTNNLKQISEAVANKTGAVITVGNTQVKLGINSARYVLGLYETAVANGTSEQFLEGLSNLNPTMVMENDNTMRHIVSKFKHEVKNFIAGAELSDDLYHALYDYYSDHGEMPYGTMKGRDGDPYEWVHMRFDQDVHDYTGSNDPDMPALPQANMSMMPRQESMYESKKVKMEEGWAEMQAMIQANAEKEKQGATGKFDKKSSGNGTVYRRKYNADTGQTIEPKVDPEGKSPVKRSRGRPSAAASSTEGGTSFADYNSWYHKSKRTHAERKIVGSRAGAVAVVPKGKKYLVVGNWENDSGMLFDAPSEMLSLEDLKAFKSAKGRPKKVREWIETLRFVSEGSVKEASKWRDAKYKDKLYTQEPPEADQDDSEDVYYNRVKPDDYQGVKRSTFDRSKDTDKLNYPYGDYQVGKKAQVGDRAKKGLLTKNAIRVVKDRIKGTQGDHPTPKLPK